MFTINNFLHLLSLHIQVRRFWRLINFLHVPFGMILAHGFLFTGPLVVKAGELFLIIGVLLYGALHALNNVADRYEDAKIKKKAHRIVARGELSIEWLLVDIVSCLLLALVLLWLYFPDFFWFGVVFIFLNVIYSFVLKRFNHIVATMVMSWSIPLRVMLGVAVVNGNILEYSLWYVLVWSGVVAEVSRKIQYEQHRYSKRLLYWVRIVMFLIFSFCAAGILVKGYQLGLLLVYCIYYVGYQLLYSTSISMRRVLHEAWTK